MQDLNDLYYFAEVVRHGGFAQAGRVLGQPKSKLSRHVTHLESTLGVRLIERTSRRFTVTELGQAFYEQCRAVVQGAEDARALVIAAQGEPQGQVRMSCPSGMMETMRPLFANFLARYPKVRLQVIETNSPVNLIEQRVNLALRVRKSLGNDQRLTVRVLGVSRPTLVGSPEFAERVSGKPISILTELPTLGIDENAAEQTWDFTDPAGRIVSVRHVPRLSCSDYSLLRECAMAGLGIAVLPDHLCRNELESRTLVRLFPDWSVGERIVHIVFTGRHGLPAAVRALVDHLVAEFEKGAWAEGAGPRFQRSPIGTKKADSLG